MYCSIVDIRRTVIGIMWRIQNNIQCGAGHYTGWNFCTPYDGTIYTGGKSYAMEFTA
jgi:long-subunit fatty acid transport protein